MGILHPPREAEQFSPDVKVTRESWSGVDPELAIMAIASNQNAQKSAGLDRQGLLRRFAAIWTAESSLKDCEIDASRFTRST
jgi:hypothetical protein